MTVATTEHREAAAYPDHHPLGRLTVLDLASVICGSARASLSAAVPIYLSIFDDFFAREFVETVEVGACPSREKIRGELVRLDYSPSHPVPQASLLMRFLKEAIGPFIEGVGKVAFKDRPKGFVIVSVD